MIEEDYVSFEIAKLLKEKGFNEKCHCSYRKKLINNKIVDEEELFVSAYLTFTNNELEDKAYKDIVYCSAPTLQMAMKWLRETFEIHCQIDCPIAASNWVYGIRDLNQDEWIILRNMGNYETYEEACEAAIKYCLEHLI